MSLQLLARNRHAQKSGSFGSWLDLSIWCRSGHEKKFARAKIDIGATARAAKTTNNGELSGWRNFARRSEIPFLNFEKVVLNQELALRLSQLWRDVVEVDAFERLIEMKLTRLAALINAIPIEHAVGGVAVLLDLDENIAAANSVKSTGR